VIFNKLYSNKHVLYLQEKTRIYQSSKYSFKKLTLPVLFLREDSSDYESDRHRDQGLTEFLYNELLKKFQGKRERGRKRQKERET
jgi:hypothetical protein